MDDEIDLRLYAEILWRARYVVLAVTLGAALAALVITRFMVPPVYEASVLLVVQPDQALNPEDPRTGRLVPALGLGPSDYQQLADVLFSPETGRASGRALAPGGSTEPAGAPRIKVRLLPQTRLLEITAEARDPETAARRANEAGAALIEEARRLQRSMRERVLSALQGQLAEADRAVEEASGRLQAFMRENPAISRLQAEQDAALQAIGRYRSRLDDLQARQASAAASLEALRASLKQEPRILSLRRTLDPEGWGAQGAAGSQAGTGALSGMQEEVNPVYVALERQIATREAEMAALRAELQNLQAALERLGQEVQERGAELIRLQAAQEQLTAQLRSAQESYENILSRYHALQSQLAGSPEDLGLSVVRPAEVPVAPSRPRPLLNAAVAGFLGLMASVFGVFLWEFWKQPVQAPSAALRTVQAPSRSE